MNLSNAQRRLSAMLLLTTIFFMVEIIVGYITNSMALIADSFHMFSDAIALVIAFISVRMSPKKWSKNTFGWARAEILGALVNAVFLCALCFSILIESIKRFIKPDLIHDPFLILIVGGLGLFINLIGLLLFKDSGHFHHHHHSHSHAHKPHAHTSKKHNNLPTPTDLENQLLVSKDNKVNHNVATDNQNNKFNLLCNDKGDHTSKQDLFNKTAEYSKSPSQDNIGGDSKQATMDKSLSAKKDGCNHTSSIIDQDKSSNSQSKTDDKCDNNMPPTDHIRLAFRPTGHHDDHHGTQASPDHHHHVHVGDDDDDNDEHDGVKHHPSSNQMNMRGVFLHVMADALGSVIVMISAIIVIYTDWTIRLYIDPILSVLMVCLILRSTWPLLTESAMILLQTVPTHIQVDSLGKRLTQEIQGVLAVHEFHVWQLAGDRIIASAHIRCHNLDDYMRIAEEVKEFFHNEGIHSTTIQPEFTDIDNDATDGSNENCVLDCPSKQRLHCAPQTCCASK